MEKRRELLKLAGWLFALMCVLGACFMPKPEPVQAGTLVGVKNLHQTDADEDSFTVEWDVDINADGYEFQYSMDKSNWSSSTYTVSLHKQVFYLNAGRSYYVRMRSYYDYWDDDAWDELTIYSAWTEPMEVITTPRIVPDDKVKQTAGTNSTISVSWEKAEGATSYEVMYYTGQSWFSAGKTTKTSYKITKLDRDTRYGVAIRAIRRAGTGFEEGYYSGWTHDCYTTAPKIKGCTLVQWDTLKNRAYLSWDGASNYNSGYQVDIMNLSGKKLKSFKTTDTSLDFKLASVKNQGFIFRVRAYKDIDGKTIYGEWSNNKVVISQPKLTLKKSGKTAIKISWQKVKGATSYSVYRSTNPNTGFKKVKTLKGTSFTNKSLSSKKTYYYYVVANGVKAEKKAYNSSKPKSREIAYLSYSGKTTYYYQ